MADWNEAKVGDRPSTIDEVRRLCKQRLEELGAHMAELEEVAKRAAGQRNTLAVEMRQIEGVLEATTQTEPPRDVVTFSEKTDRPAYGGGGFHG